MEINEEVMCNGFKIYKQSHHHGDVYYDEIFQFYSYMMNHGEGMSVSYKLCAQDMDMDRDGMVLLNGHKLSKSSHDNIVRDFYLVAEYNSWVLRGRFQNAENVYPKELREFVEFKGVRLRRYQLDEISRQYYGNLLKYFKKFVLGPVRLDRRYTNGSSLYVQIYPEDYVLKMSRLVAALQSRSFFNAKTRKRYSTDRVYALNLLKQFLASYWNVISDKAKDELRKSIIDIFTNEEFAHIQVYEAAYEFMEKVAVIDNAQMWISLEQILRDAARPGVQIAGFRLLHHKSLEEKEELLQEIIQDVELVKVGLMDGPPELRTAILETAVKHFRFMDAELAPTLLESVHRTFTNKADREAELSVGLIKDLVTREAASSGNVFCSKPFLEATVKFILPLARSKQVQHRVVRRCANNIIKLIAVISLDANDPYFFSEVMERYRDMMNYYDGEFTWDLSPTLSPTTGPESDYAMGKRYACGLIEHLHHERPSFFGRIEEFLLNKVENWIALSSYRDQHAAVETCAMLKPRLAWVECLESCTTCPIARRLLVVIKALKSKNSRVQWAGANYLKDLMGLIRSDVHNLKISLRTLLSNLRSTSGCDEVKECALLALEALDA